jgi:hypothetical protein
MGAGVRGGGRRARRLHQRAKVRFHAQGIGLQAGEQFEGADGLAHGHGAAVHRAAACRARGAQQLGLQREIHDFGHPQAGMQQGARQRQAGQFVHACRRGVDEAGRACQGVIDPGHGQALPAIHALHRGRELLRACRVLVHDAQLASPTLQHGVGDGRTGASRAQQHHAREVRVGQGAGKPPGPARAIGVVAHEPSAAQHHGIDGAHAPRLVG